MSSAPTEESKSEDENDAIDSDEILDLPTQCDVIGEKVDVSHEPGKVTKEIITIGDTKAKPNFGWLCKIKYVAYFYDKTIFDTSPENGEGTVELFIGDISWPEGLWKGMQHMRKGERAKIRIAKKHGFGRTGEIEVLRFPKGFSTSEEDAERRAKLTSKGVIYDCTMIDWIERMDMNYPTNSTTNVSTQ